MPNLEGQRPVEDKNAQAQRIFNKMAKDMIGGVGFALLSNGHHLPERINILTLDEVTKCCFVAEALVRYLDNDKKISPIIHNLASFSPDDKAIDLVYSFLQKNPGMPLLCDRKTAAEVIEDSLSKVVVRAPHFSVVERPTGSITLFH